MTSVIVTNLALLRHCGTVPWLVRALSCPCCGHPWFILPQGTALALLPDSTMHTMLCFLLLVILLGLMDKYSYSGIARGAGIKSEFWRKEKYQNIFSSGIQHLLTHGGA